MKIDEIKNCVHDLANKITLIEGKLDKARALSRQDEVNVELDKAIKNSALGLELLSRLKCLLEDN